MAGIELLLYCTQLSMCRVPTAFDGEKLLLPTRTKKRGREDEVQKLRHPPRGIHTYGTVVFVVLVSTYTRETWFSPPFFCQEARMFLTNTYGTHTLEYLPDDRGLVQLQRLEKSSNKARMRIRSHESHSCGSWQRSSSFGSWHRSSSSAHSMVVLINARGKPSLNDCWRGGGNSGRNDSLLFRPLN